MLRARLLAATAVATLFATPALAQEAASAPQDQAQRPVGVTVRSTPATPAPASRPDQAMAPAPAAAAAQAATTAQAATPAAANTLIDVLRAEGQFTTLLAALEQAQLTETLRTRPAISIFAPTDAAFAALPEAERARLMAPENVNELRQLLLYHVIVADVNSTQIKGALGPVETAATTKVQLDGTGEAIRIDSATVTKADIDASNGAVFAIDRVLNPAESMAAMGDGDEDETEAAASDAPARVNEPADEVVTETTTPAAPGDTAPNGQQAATTTTVASPPVVNPTDGQVDDPAATPPIVRPDPADEDIASPPADEDPQG